MKTDLNSPKRNLRELTWRSVSLFCALFILSFPLKLHVVPDVSSILSSFFESLIHFSAVQIFSIRSNFTAQIMSDSTGMYIHVFNLLVISLLTSIVWRGIDRRQLIDHKYLYWIRTTLVYYLAFQLLIYGFIKVFKWQFYLPEPNLLYTNLGNIPKNMLYWSTMGVSRSYVMTMGLIEVFAGILLLFNRTRALGAMASVLIFINIFTINMGFDIDVKLFSFLLLSFSCIASYPYIQAVVKASWHQSTASFSTWRPMFKEHHIKYLGIKLGVILLFFIEGLYPYFDTGNFNDDRAERLKYHGVYEVTDFHVNGQEISQLIDQRWQRVYVHRMHYFIIENLAEQTQDFEIYWNLKLQSFSLKDYDGKSFEFNFTQQEDSLRSIYGVLYGDTIAAQLKPLNWRALPLLQNEFNWSFDDLQ